MSESKARDWVLVWMEDLHRRAGSKRFWEEEQERINLATCCFHSFLQPRIDRFLNDALSLIFFQPITARFFSINSRSFSYALHSDNSS